MSSPFATLPPKATLNPKPFTAHTPDQTLSDFHQLLKLSKIGPQTYENSTADVKDFTSFGISRAWLSETKEYWQSGQYDWRKCEDRINAFPNFTVDIRDEGAMGHTFSIHFLALFSRKKDAVPVLLMHGWPGSPLEFLGALEILAEKYTPETLPFHVVVPSLPGYAFSSGPPVDGDFDVQGIARVMDALMGGLGFGEEEGGYIAQGGDIGSFVARVLAVRMGACRGVHCESSLSFFLFLFLQGVLLVSFRCGLKTGLGRDDCVLSSLLMTWLTDFHRTRSEPFHRSPGRD